MASPLDTRLARNHHRTVQNFRIAFRTLMVSLLGVTKSKRKINGAPKKAPPVYTVFILVWGKSERPVLGTPILTIP